MEECLYESQKQWLTLFSNALLFILIRLQELNSTEGDVQFSGVLDGIEQLVKNSVPIIVQGAGGYDSSVAKRLLNAG